MAPFIFDENDFLLPKMAIVWSVKYTLVCKIHACHVTSLIKVPINFYCEGGVLLCQVTTSYDMWLLRFQGGVHPPPLRTMYVK